MIRTRRRTSVTPESSLDAAGRGVAADDPEYLAEPARTVGLLAETLGRLHASALPPDARTIDRSSLAAELGGLLANRPDGERVADPAYRHVTVRVLLDVLVDGADPARDAHPVPTHGRPTLSHLRVADGASVGLSDWSEAGAAPAARDLAVALRSLVAAFGPGVAPAFISAYPADAPSVEQVDWWVLASVLAEHAGSLGGDA